MLVEYVRYHEKPVGCVVALDRHRIGWSQCRTELDNFNKKMGKKIAVGRAEKGYTRKPCLYKFDDWNPTTHKPITIKIDLIGQAMADMQIRAEKYFK